jgi:hypothetical protein
MPRNRRQKEDRIWDLIEPNRHGYSSMIARLLGLLSNRQIEDLLESMDPDYGKEERE